MKLVFNKTAAEARTAMSDQPIPDGSPAEQTRETANSPSLPSRFDPAMAQICIGLCTRATLYAGAVGLIAGLAAVLFAGE